MNLSDYTKHDGLGLAKLVRSGVVNRADLIDAANAAIDTVNPRLNAVIGRLDPPAFNDQAPADAPFGGVPFLLKDLGHGWAGIRCDMGSRIAEGYVVQEDSHLSTRFKAAGLVAVGRTNTPEFGINGTTEPELYGPTSNPWDLARSPGGSSGGSAAAVAAGIVPVAHASDGGGSIRVPAAWCGLVGLKPSRGRNPIGPGGSDATGSIIAHHVISRTVRDTAAMLDVTSGPTGSDFIAMNGPGQGFLAAVTQKPDVLRIALCTRFKDAPQPEGPCVEAAVAAAKLCASLGHEVTEITPDIAYPEMSGLCFDLFMPALAAGVERMMRITGRSTSSATLEPQTLATLKKGRVMTALDLIERFNRQADISRRMSLFMQDYDILLTPGVSRVPCMTGEFGPNDYEKDDLGYWDREMECYTFSPLASLTGQPALVLPLYWTVSGLPVGVQFVSRIGDDATLLSLAGQLEQAQPWTDRRAPIHVANS